jgi:hypothetical protein
MDGVGTSRECSGVKSEMERRIRWGSSGDKG